VNEKGENVPLGSYDPANDVAFLEEELDYWYLDLMKKGWEKFHQAGTAESAPSRQRWRSSSPASGDRGDREAGHQGAGARP